MENLIEYELEVRRILRGAQQVGAARISLDGIEYGKYVEFITYIAKSMGMNVKCSRARDNRILVKYLDKPKRKTIDLSDLTSAGDSKRFEIEPARESYLRSRVSMHARSLGFASSVVREAPGQLVAMLIDLSTQQGPTETAAPRAPGRPRLHPSKLKYPIGTLEVGDSVLIDLPPEKHDNVRKSANAWARNNRQKLSCNIDGDGIRVTRTA